MAGEYTILLQKLVHVKSGKEFDRSFLKELTYVEPIDLSGPRIIMVFDDHYSYHRSHIGVKPGDKLEITLFDVQHREKLNETFEIVIFTMPYKEPLLTLNCFHADVHKLKVPAVKARLFSKMSPDEVVKEPMPGVQYDIDKFPVMEPYHLLPGERSSLVMRQVARENAADIWFCRKILKMKKLRDVYRQAPAIEYEWKNPNVPNQIINYHQINVDKILKDRIEKAYTGFHLTDGLVHGGQPDREAEWAGVGNQATLDNMGKLMIPVVDIICKGNGELEPGLSMKFIWNSVIAEKPIDDSLPDHGVVGTVAHYTVSDNYFCRFKVLVPAEELI
jgi:hypothetical protein